MDSSLRIFSGTTFNKLKNNSLSYFITPFSSKPSLIHYINNVIVKYSIIFFSCTFRYWACHLSKCKSAFNFCVRH